jgi:hypothetical protein
VKKLITVLLGLAMALGTVTLSLAGEQQDQGAIAGSKKARKGGKRKGKRGKKGKGMRNRNGGGQTPGGAPTTQP